MPRKIFLEYPKLQGMKFKHLKMIIENKYNESLKNKAFLIEGKIVDDEATIPNFSKNEIGAFLIDARNLVITNIHFFHKHIFDEGNNRC
jgi:hypothetical protein